MIVAISGIRDIAPESYADVDLAIADLVDADEVRFGGALGADTVALEAACDLLDATLRVFVPGTLAQQPAAARQAIRRCDPIVVELGLPLRRDSYLRRNDRMIAGADLLLAFTDGRSHGGTAYTIRAAHEIGLAVIEVAVVGKTTKRNPLVLLPEPVADVHAIAPYVSLHTHRSDRPSKIIRALKKAAASEADIQWLAELVARYITEHPDLASRLYLAPMPRRATDLPSDLLPLALEVGKRTGQRVLVDWLIRYRTPERGGYIHAGRQKFPPAEHERTMVVDGDVALAPDVIVLDNVVTRGGTMVGAQRAILRDSGHAPVGLAVLFSGPLASAS